jgi:hypothetical protein
MAKLLVHEEQVVQRGGLEAEFFDGRVDLDRLAIGHVGRARCTRAALENLGSLWMWLSRLHCRVLRKCEADMDQRIIIGGDEYQLQVNLSVELRSASLRGC